MPRYPSLLEINARVWLNHLSRKAGRPRTLADIDEATFDGFAEQGLDWIWLLSVWQTGAAGRAVSRGNPQWRAEFKALLPDLTEDDICGSGFAITAYSVSDALGGDAALARFREKLARRGIKLMLDFVPNHTAPDHLWVKGHPGYYVEGSEEALAASPENYLRVETNQGPKILAYGRDPNFAGWPDTLQLNYANLELQKARIDELITIAGKCDGVRCDMAMLLLPDIFQRTWGVTPDHFGQRRSRPCMQSSRTSPSWPRFIGISNRLCSSRVLPIATISGSMTGCGSVTPRWFVVICSPGSITRTSWRAFSKTTTSRARRLNFDGPSTPPRRSSPFSLLVCAFFTKARSKELASGCRRISVEVRSSREIPK